jgi:copper homeostasis protein
MIELEICINSDGEQSVKQAVREAYLGGASRIELCSSMHLDGLTPEKDKIIEARKAFGDRIGLMVMIRPRAGNFLYTEDEITLMKKQIVIAANTGADGVVFGVLNKNNQVDTDLASKLCDTAKKQSLSVTFHRAFDAVKDQDIAMENLRNAGVNRILSSGTAWESSGSAIDGIQNIRENLKKLSNSIELVVGGGINISNIKDLLNLLGSNASKTSIHAFTGAQEKGLTTRGKVEELAKICRSFNPKPFC